MKNKIILIAFYTLVRHEMIRMFRIAAQAFLPPIITMSLYFVIFGHIVGQKIGDMHGVSYATYIAPGLVMIGVINNAYINVSSSFFLARFTRSIEELLISPSPSWTIMLGFVVGGVIRAVIIAIAILLVASYFTPLPLHNIMMMIFIILATALLFALAGFTNGLFAKSFDDIAIVPTFILTPLTYLGGVFYSPALLPPFWHKISVLNPVWYMVDAFRYGIIGISDVNPLLEVSIISACVVALFTLNVILMNKGIGLKK